jgi:hypothetical protein
MSRVLEPLRLAAAVAAALVGGCAAIPSDPLRPPADERLVATVVGVGVQIHECRAGSNGAASWTFIAPEADLLDEHGRRVGSHGAGPFWQSVDGSRVVGSVVARADAPRPGAVPWLLLQTRSTGGAGAFAGVVHIQRVRTEGGVAPADGCGAGSIGERRRVPYRADYLLYARA